MYIPGTDSALPYLSRFSVAHHDETAMLRHVNCSLLSTPGIPPTLLALSQHAQSLSYLISVLKPHGGDEDTIEVLLRRATESNSTHEPSSKGLETRDGAATTHVVERLDHEYAGTGGLPSLLPTDIATQTTADDTEVEESLETTAASNTLLGQWLVFTQQLVGRPVLVCFAGVPSIREVTATATPSSAAANQAFIDIAASVLLLSASALEKRYHKRLEEAGRSARDNTRLAKNLLKATQKLGVLQRENARVETLNEELKTAISHMQGEPQELQWTRSELGHQAGQISGSRFHCVISE
ncbi:hypothetical protein SEUCBS139899_002418 [Sporothrix eucalyptigena]